MTSRRVTRNPEDDVTTGYSLHTSVSRRFSIERIEDWHEPAQINLGPNVEDITVGVTRLGGAGLPMMVTTRSPVPKMKTAGQ